MAEQAGAKSYGLLLTLPGATGEAHTIPGLHGWFWADKPTPVGGEGEIPLEDARKASKDKGTAVELVEMTKTETDERRNEIAAFRAHARRALRTVTPHTADERERKQYELAAAAGKES